MKQLTLFKLKYGKREHTLRAFRDSKNKVVETAKNATKVENSTGEIFPLSDVECFHKQYFKS